MKQIPTTKLYSDGEDRTLLHSPSFVRPRVQAHIENAENLVHGLNIVLNKSLEKVAGEADGENVG